MDIVKQVADAIAEIPGERTNMEIARVAIEEYQKALWTPLFGRDNRLGLPASSGPRSAVP